MLNNPITMGEIKMSHKKKSHAKSKHSSHMVKVDGIPQGSIGIKGPMAHEKSKKHHSRGK